MGRPKLSLEWHGRPLLDFVIRTLREGGVENVLVVVGPQVAHLTAIAQAAGAFTLQLTQPTADMRETVLHGLNWLDEQFSPAEADPWLLAPADHPTLEPEVVACLLKAYPNPAGKTIILPTHAGQRGHPTLLSWQHVAGLRALPTGLGINAYVRGHPQLMELPVPSVSVLLDLDTPDDYASLSRKITRL